MGPNKIHLVEILFYLLKIYYGRANKIVQVPICSPRVLHPGSLSQLPPLQHFLADQLHRLKDLPAQHHRGVVKQPLLHHRAYTLLLPLQLAPQ
jgi:hypothetical protein